MRPPAILRRESARRLADSDGLPQLTMEGPRAFFDKVEEEIVEPAVWVGELYLEHHRGTYTSQAETKNQVATTNAKSQVSPRASRTLLRLRAPPRTVPEMREGTSRSS